MRLLLLFVAMAGVFLGAWLVWGDSWSGWFTVGGTVEWLKAGGSWAWAAGIGLLVADLVLPLPGTVVMSSLGYIYGPWLGGLFALAGQMLAGLAGYGAGRLPDETFVRRWLGDGDFEKGRKFFENGGGWAVAFSRALPILPEVVSCMAGISRMGIGKFSAALFCGSLPMSLLFAGIGALGKEAPWWALAASLGVPGVLWLLGKRIWNIENRTSKIEH